MRRANQYTVKGGSKNIHATDPHFLHVSVPFHLFGNGGGALAIGKNYARNAQIGKKLRRKILKVIPCLIC